MKALTLWPEWAYAFWKLGKDGENRDWPLWQSMIGKPIAIHAGVLSVHAESGSKRWAHLKSFYDTVHSATGKLVFSTQMDAIRGHIVAVATFGEPTQQSASKWAANDGQFFWPAVHVQPLMTPVDCRKDGVNHQGLWNVRPDLEHMFVGQP